MLNKILNLFYSIYFNLKYMPFSIAIKFPIVISYKTKIYHLKKGDIQIKSNNVEKFMIKIGFDGSSFVSENNSSINIVNNGKMILGSHIKIAEGVNIFVDNGNLVIGNNIYINRNILIQCTNKINIDDDCLIGWNISLRDTSGHKVKKNGFNSSKKNEINIGKRVWIASDVTIVGDNNIKSNCIVACNSIVTNFQSSNENKLIAGIPAKEKDGDYEWEN